MTTVRDILDAVMTRIQLAGGAGVQLYGDPAVLSMMNDQHTLLFDKYWWPWAMTIGDEYDLTGTDGTIVGDLSNLIKRYDDLQYVWLNNAPSPLPRYQSLTNPKFAARPGIVPVSDPTKVFKIVPTTQTGSVVLSYRTQPAPFMLDTDVVLMDKQLMVFACAYDYINSLGFNPNEEAKLQSMLQSRLATLIDNTEGKMVPMGNSNYTYSVDGWQ